MTTPVYTHMVKCFDQKDLTKPFTDIKRAINYANQLLRDGHKIKIYPYREPKRYVDYLAERGPNG